MQIRSIEYETLLLALLLNIYVTALSFQLTCANIGLSITGKTRAGVGISPILLLLILVLWFKYDLFGICIECLNKI